VSPACRFEDVWTDASVSKILWDQASSKQCLWWDGQTHCGRYKVMSITSICCATVDFGIAVTFTIAGFSLEHSGSAHRGEFHV
jgi:hypothetical protein